MNASVCFLRMNKSQTNSVQYYHAPLWVRSGIGSQHSPERSILSCISCLQQLHVKRGQVAVDVFEMHMIPNK